MTTIAKDIKNPYVESNECVVPPENELFKYNTRMSDDRILFLEDVDVNRMGALLRSKKILVIHEKRDKYSGKLNEWDEKIQLNNILKKQNKGTLKVRYNSGKKFGRVYAKKGITLATLSKRFRGFVTNEKYYDIDMINCQPVILLKLCKDNGIKCTELSNYVRDRESIFKSLKEEYNMERDVSKRCFLRIIFGGKPSTIVKENNLDELPKVFKNFHREVRGSMNYFKNKYPVHFDYVSNKAKKDYNLDGTFLSIILQGIEQQLLQFALDTAIENEVVSSVPREGRRAILCYDGIMLEKSSFHMNSIDLEDYIEILNTNEWGVTFKSKPIDPCNSILTALKEEDIDPTEEYEIISQFEKKYGHNESELPRADKVTDEFLSQLFLHSQNGKYISTPHDSLKVSKGGSNSYYKRNVNGLCIQITADDLKKDVKGYLKPFITNADRLLANKTFNYEKAIMNCITSAGEGVINGLSATEIGNVEGSLDVKELMRFVKKNIKSESSNVVKKKIENSLGMTNMIKNLTTNIHQSSFHDVKDTNDNVLGFNNGVLDCKTYEFRNANDDEFITMSCGYDFKLLSQDDELYIKVHNVLKAWLENDDDTDYLLKSVSRCLRGSANLEQTATFLKGEGSNGKSVLFNIIKGAFGQYASSLPSSELTAKELDVRNPTIYGLRKSRIITVAEPDNGEDVKFNSDTFKRMTGGDDITCRTNFQTQDISFTISPMFIGCNHHVEFTTGEGDAMERRVRSIIFPLKFTNDESKLKSKGGNNNYRLADKSVVAFIKTDEFKNATMNILLNYLKKYDIEGGLREISDAPINIQKASNVFLSNIDPFLGWVADNLIKKSDCNVTTASLHNLYKTMTGSSLGIRAFNTKLRNMKYTLGNCRGVDLYSRRSKMSTSLKGFYVLNYERLFNINTNKNKNDNDSDDEEDFGLV